MSAPPATGLGHLNSADQPDKCRDETPPPDWHFSYTGGHVHARMRITTPYTAAEVGEIVPVINCAERDQNQDHRQDQDRKTCAPVQAALEALYPHLLSFENADVRWAHLMALHYSDMPELAVFKGKKGEHRHQQCISLFYFILFCFCS